MKYLVQLVKGLSELFVESCLMELQNSAKQQCMNSHFRAVTDFTFPKNAAGSRFFSRFTFSRLELEDNYSIYRNIGFLQSVPAHTMLD